MGKQKLASMDGSPYRATVLDKVIKFAAMLIMCSSGSNYNGVWK